MQRDNMKGVDAEGDAVLVDGDLGPEIVRMEGGPIASIQRDLKKMGIPVNASGKIDQATVDAVNNVFRGWDDAPPALKSGNLSAKSLSRNAGTVARLMRRALSGSQTFEDVNE